MRDHATLLRRAITGLSVLTLTLSAVPLRAADIPANTAVSGPLAGTGQGLRGEYWRRPVASIATDGQSNPANRIDVQIQGFGAPNGTFRATRFVYLGNDLSPVIDWLSSDGPSFVGTTSPLPAGNNLDDGAFRFTGYLNVAAPGTVRIGTTSDDGSRVKVGGVDVVANDGSHGDQTVDADANFTAAGLYPIEITFFNGDWTSDGGHNGSPNPADHGGANFHLRINNADITPAQVGSLLFDEIPDVLPNFVNVGGNKVGSVSSSGVGSYTLIGGGNDIWDQKDEFSYKYTEVSGDFDVQVRVESFTPNARWSKAGLMARESLSEFSRMIFPRIAPEDVPTSNGGNGANDNRVGYRTGKDNVDGQSGGNHEVGSGLYHDTTLMETNDWLRLIRSGDVFTAQRSSNGVDWVTQATLDTADAGAWGGGPLAKKLFLGLAASRHSGGLTATAEFRSFQFNTNPGPFNVVAANSRGNPNGVRVDFSRPVGAGAYTAGNYTIENIIIRANVPVVGLRFTSGNDAPERDPMTFTLEGTTGDPFTGPWTTIAMGNTGLDTARGATAPDVTFANAATYTSYRIIFPTVRDAGAANSMQIGEVAFLDANGSDITQPGDSVSGSSFNYPGGENPGNAIDDNTGSKYLNFDKLNAGFTVTPRFDLPAPNPTVNVAGTGSRTELVQLTTSALTEGARYRLTVANVLDVEGNALTTATADFVHGAGFEPRRIHVTHNKVNDSGYYRFSDAVAKGIGDVIALGGGTFPGSQVNALFEDPVPDNGSNERFSTRVAGVLAPSTTGNHTFYMSSDDQGFLYLSSDSNPANKVQIANEPEWNGSRQYLVTDRRGTPPSNISAPKALDSAGKYYLELVFTEGGGGNNGSATWLPPGGAAIANGSLPISENNFMPSRQFDGNVFTTLGPVQIVQNPQSQTVLALSPVTFAVRADGTPGYRYQWRRNGQPISGANGSSYTIAVTQPADDQTTYSCEVRNEFSSVVSGAATLTVLTPNPPHLLGASADDTFRKVTVRFDNRLREDEATNVANYAISGGPGAIMVESAMLTAGSSNVMLTVSQLAEDTTYTVTITDLRDQTGSTVIDPNPSSTNFQTLAWAGGFVLRQQTTQFSGGNVDPFVTAHRNGTVIYTKECLTNLWEYNNADVGLQGTQPDNYGGRISGYFTPSESGAHVFYLASDDPGRLFLSTDSNPANVVPIATEPVWANRREWTGEAGGGGRVGTPSPSGGPQLNISGPINLTAGTRYYLESFFTEGGGGDHVAVAVQGPSDAVPVNGSSPITSDKLGVFILPGNLTINTQPADQTNDENSFVTFSVGASYVGGICGADTLSYQWFTNGVAVTGATGPAITYGPVTLADDGLVFSVSISAPARAAVSSNAVLTVVADTNPPVLLSARADGTFTNIYLTWSEVMTEGSAIEPSSYRLADSANNEILSAVASVTYGGSSVTLHLANPLASDGSTYTIEAGFQTDVAGNAPDPLGNPELDPASGVVMTLRSWVSTPCGGVEFSLFSGLSTGDNNIRNTLLADPRFPNNPTERRVIDGMSSRLFYPDDSHEGYGGRMRGLFIPPVSGNWVFYIRSDDSSILYMNTTGPSEAGKVIVQEETGCCNAFSVRPTAPIPLVGGQGYYMEMVYKEGTGGDYAFVAGRLQGQPAPTADTDALPGSFFGSPAAPPGVGGPIVFTQQPANQTVGENSTATFTAAASNPNGLPICYQWTRDGNPIPGATGPTLTFGPVTLADNGAVFRVIASVVGTVSNSEPAILTVVQDATPPTVLSVRGNRKFDAVIVKYSELMAEATVEEPTNYTLTDSANNPVAIGTPVLGGDGMTVTIPTTAPLNVGAFYTLAVSGYRDLANNPGDPTNFTFQTWILSRGIVNFEAFLGLTVPDYQNPQPVIDAINNNVPPSFEFQTNQVNWPQSNPNLDNYGMHFFGLFRAPMTGTYKFEPAHDDSGNLLFSPDANPANATVVMDFDCCSGFGPNEPGYTVNLVGGQSYYFDLRVVEAGGGDYAGLSVTLPTHQYIAPIPRAFLETYADPVGAFVTFTSQPVGTTFPSPSGYLALSENFNAGDGGFTVNTPAAYDGPWTYNAGSGSWIEDGQGPENSQANTSMLNSPSVTITGAGPISVSFTHRHSFEDGAWDGGQVRVSINGGPFTAVPASAFSAGGYNGTVLGNSASALAGQAAFINDSPGHGSGAMITSVADLGVVNAGDTVQVQFIAANDTNTKGATPNWEITDVRIACGYVFHVALRASVNHASPSTFQGVLWQWQRKVDGTWNDILGANGSLYAFTPAPGTLADYRVLAFVPGASAVSDAATVTGLMVIDWDGAPTILQEADEITGPWTDIPGASDPYVINPRLSTKKFFRQKPTP